MSWIQKKQSDNRRQRDVREREQEERKRRSLIEEAKAVAPATDSKLKFGSQGIQHSVNHERVKVEARLEIRRRLEDIDTPSVELALRHYENKGSVDKFEMHRDGPHTEVVLKGTMAFVEAMTNFVDALNQENP